MIIIAAASFCAVADTLAQDKSQPTKRVLVIFVFIQEMPWPHYIEESMRAALTKKFGSSLEFNVEYADQLRFPEKAYRSKAIDLYRYILRAATVAVFYRLLLADSVVAETVT